MDLTESQKVYKETQPRFGGRLIIKMEYEPYYELVKNEPNKMWELWNSDIEDLIGRCVKRWGLRGEELLSDAYIYFLKACNKYTPHYKGGFYPAKNYIMNYIELYFRNYPKVHETELKLTKFKQIPLSNHVTDNAENLESNKIEIATAITESQVPESELIELINKLPEAFSKAIKMSMNGKKQWQIAEELGVTQSRVSLMFRYLRNAVENRNDPDVRQRLTKYEEIDITAVELFDYCHDNKKVEFTPKKNKAHKELSKDDKRLKNNLPPKKKETIEERKKRHRMNNIKHIQMEG